MNAKRIKSSHNRGKNKSVIITMTSLPFFIRTDKTAFLCLVNLAKVVNWWTCLKAMARNISMFGKCHIDFFKFPCKGN